MRLWVLAAGCALVAVAGGTLASARTYEHARALGTRCSTCHTSTRPHLANLNDAGRYFLKHRTLEGFVPDAGRRSPAGAAGAAGESRGAEVYRRSCAVCHGDKGQGTILGRALTGPLQHARTDAEIAAVIRDGIEGTSMVAFRGALTAAEIDAVARHVAGLRK